MLCRLKVEVAAAMNTDDETKKKNDEINDYLLKLSRLTENIEL